MNLRIFLQVQCAWRLRAILDAHGVNVDWKLTDVIVEASSSCEHFLFYCRNEISESPRFFVALSTHLSTPSFMIH